MLAGDETDLLLFPPLRAAWSPRGEPRPVVLSGWNAKRVLTGAINIRTGHRLRQVRSRQRGPDFQEFLRLIHHHYRAWNVTLLVDEHASHTAKASRALAAEHHIQLLDLPKRSPHLNPMDHLWRHVKGVALSNRQHATIDDLATHALAYFDSLSPQEALRMSGLCSDGFWLHDLL